MMKEWNIGRTCSLLIVFMTIMPVIFFLWGYFRWTGGEPADRYSDPRGDVVATVARAQLSVQQYVPGRNDTDLVTHRLALDGLLKKNREAQQSVTDPEVSRQLDLADQQVRRYTDSFSALIDAMKGVDQPLFALEEQSRKVLDLLNRTREQEAMELTALRQDGQESLIQQRTLADAATQIYNTAQEARVYRTSLMRNNDLSTMAHWKKTNQKLKTAVRRIRTQLSLPENVELADRILVLQETYIGDVLNYLKTIRTEDHKRMTASVKSYHQAITALQFGLRRQFDRFLQSDRQQVDEKLLLDGMVNRMTQLFMDARVGEQAVIAARDIAQVADIRRAIDAIGALENDIATRVDSEVASDRIRPLTTALAAYQSALDRALAAIRQHHQAEDALQTAALAVMQTAAGANPQGRDPANQGKLPFAAVLSALFVWFALGAWGVWIVVVRQMRPLRHTTEFLDAAAAEDADLTRRLTVSRHDEVGRMASGVNALVARLETMVNEADRYMARDGALNERFSSFSRQMHSGIQEIQKQSVAVHQMAEEMNHNLNAVAEAGEATSHHVGLAASAMDQVSQGVVSMGQQSNTALSTTRRAVEEAGQASDKMARLDKAAIEISKVTQMISDISDQTNLLALNATIEAARAGDAGKGFAVVANEIKALARQTGEATQGIRSEIEGIQAAMAETVADISRITHVVGEVDEIVAGIASAIESQADTTEKISGSVLQASTDIREVNQHLGRERSVSEEMVTGLGEISRIAGEVADSIADQDQPN